MGRSPRRNSKKHATRGLRGASLTTASVLERTQRLQGSGRQARRAVLGTCACNGIVKQKRYTAKVFECHDKEGEQALHGHTQGRCHSAGLFMMSSNHLTEAAGCRNGTMVHAKQGRNGNLIASSFNWSWQRMWNLLTSSTLRTKGVGYCLSLVYAVHSQEDPQAVFENTLLTSLISSLLL